MTQDANMTEKCEFCDKRGLPLLLVRDAVVTNDSTAPVSADQPFELPAHAAHYTRRVLRQGYANVYDEARKRWETYFITSGGYYFKMPLTPGAIPVRPLNNFSCQDPGHRAVAGCITVSDPSKATIIWIGISDVMWTDTVREKNEKRALRETHMISVDVRTLLAGGQLKNCRPIAQVSAVVAEYALTAAKGDREFAWNSHQPFASREKATARLIAECEKLRPGKAHIVTVRDPVGIATELPLLMKRNVEFFNRDPKRVRMVTADASVSAIEAGVRDHGIRMGKLAGEQSARSRQRQIARSGASAEIRQAIKGDLDFTPAEAEEAANKAWVKYAKKYNEQDRKDWRTQHLKNLAQYDERWITPLAVKHVAIMKSEALAHHMESNYDARNIHSGTVYTHVVLHCATGTPDKTACANLYNEWLEGDFSNTKNLLLRALIYNQDELAAPIDKASNVEVDKRSIPWDNLIGLFSESTKKIAGGGYDILADLLVTLSGPIARLLTSVVDGRIGIRGVVMYFGMVAKHPVIKIEVTDKRLAFRKLVAKELIARSGLAMDQTKLHQAIGAEMELLGIDGELREGSIRTSWLLFIDENMPPIDPTLSEAEKTRILLTHVRTAADVERLNLGRFRTVITGDVKIGVLGGIFQYVALRKLLEDEKKASKSDKFEARARLVAGSVSLAATTSDALTNVYLGNYFLKYGTAHPSNMPSLILKIGKGLGIFASLIVAWQDAEQAITSHKEKQKLMRNLYIGSATSGVALGFFLAFPALLGAAAIPVIGLLFVAVVSIAILIEYFKDNAIQDWLERCAWGTMPNERYANGVLEQAAYQKALKG